MAYHLLFVTTSHIALVLITHIPPFPLSFPQVQENLHALHRRDPQGSGRRDPQSVPARAGAGQAI